MIDRNHSAVEAAWRALTLTQGAADGVPLVLAFPTALRAALPHLTADDLRDTPAGKQLLAEGWEAACRKVIHMAWADSSDAEYLADEGNPYRQEVTRDAPEG